MLGFFRGFLNTWAARAFFLLLVAAFVLWGVNDVVRNSGGVGTDVAVVGRERISPQQLADAYRNQLVQIARATNNRPLNGDEKARVAQLTLEQLVQDALVTSSARAMGLAAPDEAVRQAIYAIPAFQGPSGQFSRPALNGWLSQNGMTEVRLIEIIRSSLLHDQLMEPLRAGAAAPEVLVRTVFAAQNETRTASYVAFPFEAAPEPPAPTEEQLRQLYDDNPGPYTAPEYRRVRAVVLSPDTIAKTIEVSDADIAAAYENNKSRYVQGEQRAADVVVAPDAATAEKIAAAWTDGADWDAVSKEAAADNATSVQFPDSAADEFPSDELRQAVFAAEPGRVSGPEPGASGSSIVLRVTNVVPAKNQTLADVHDSIRNAIARERGQGELADHKEKLENELSAVSKLEDLPAGLGVDAVAGTLDAHGNTPEGEPAPIPATAAVRDAIVAAAFAADKDALPVLQDGPDETSFAVQVETVTPPAMKPFDAVREQLGDDFAAAARRRSEDEAATKLLTAAQAGNLDDAATVAGLRVVRTPALRIDTAPPEGVPPQLVERVFDLKKGQVTTVEAPDGFYVATTAEISDPNPSTNPVAATALRTTLNKALADDVEITYVNALRGRVQPTVNRDVLETATQ